MKPDNKLSATDNILAMVNAANPGLDILPNQVTFSTPVPDEQTPGVTTLTMLANLDKGYSGTVEVDYIRHGLDAYVTPTPTLVTGTELEGELLTKLTQSHGLVSSELNVVQFTFPSIEGPQITTAVLTSIPDSVIYLETTVDVTLTIVELSEKTRISNTGDVRTSQNGIVRFAVDAPVV